MTSDKTRLPDRTSADAEPRRVPVGAESGHAGVRAMLKLLLFAVLTCGLTAAFADLQTVYFAEPYSGKKVAQYRIELPVSRDQTRGFTVPGECASILQAADAGGRQWGSRVERGVWWKVERDCRYHEFLTRYHGAPTQDFVSGYDFMNAYLRDLPIGFRCRDPVAGSGDPKCPPLPAGIAQISQFLPFADRGPEAPRSHAEPCRLEDGIFRGRLVRDASGTHCEPDPDAPGFRVIATDYADVNGDGVLDVVLRLVPLAPGASRMPLILPLTRMSPEGAFDVPQETRLPPIDRQP